MIPKFDCFHRSLHSSFLMLPQYRAFLNQHAFSGYLYISNDSNEIYCFMKKGRDIGSCVPSTSGLRSVSNTMDVIDGLGSYHLSSYRCPDGLVDYFSRLHNVEPLYQDISLDKMGALAGLMAQLENKKVTGYLESSKTDGLQKYIYYYNGKILGYLNVKSSEGLFEQGIDRAIVQAALLHSTVNVYRFVMHAGGVKRGKSPSTEIEGGTRQRYSSEQSADGNRNHVVLCYEKILTHLSEETRQGDFGAIWRNCAMELSAEYPFLNPFAGEFHYRDGKIDLWEKVETSVAALGLDALVNAVAKQSNLPKDGIKSLKNDFSDILIAYEIKN